MATVTIGCRLPHGLVIENPLNPAQTATIRGLNTVLIVGQSYNTTQVDADLWKCWRELNDEFPAIKNGAIFEAKSEAAAASIAAEVAKEATGFEPLPQDFGGVEPSKE